MVSRGGLAWSPDGSRILFACRTGARNAAGVVTFEICVMEVANGHITQLTFNNANHLTPTWSPDGEAIVLHRAPPNQLFVMRNDGSGQTQLTTPPGLNLLATSRA